MQRILVVEDDFDIQELLQNFLQETGYEVDIAGDGVEALSIFVDGKYDLILLDIMLPKIDGYGVCELIRKQSDVPIIMLTALNGEDDQIKGLDLQVDDYITKPFSMPILIRKIAAEAPILRFQLNGGGQHPSHTLEAKVLDDAPGAVVTQVHPIKALADGLLDGLLTGGILQVACPPESHLVLPFGLGDGTEVEVGVILSHRSRPHPAP